jgi:hypothetical protein
VFICGHNEARSAYSIELDQELYPDKAKSLSWSILNLLASLAVCRVTPGGRGGTTSAKTFKPASTTTWLTSTAPPQDRSVLGSLITSPAEAHMAIAFDFEKEFRTAESWNLGPY